MPIPTLTTGILPEQILRTTLPWGLACQSTEQSLVRLHVHVVFGLLPRSDVLAPFYFIAPAYIGRLSNMVVCGLKRQNHAEPGIRMNRKTKICSMFFSDQLLAHTYYWHHNCAHIYKQLRNTGMCVCKNARFVGALYCQVRDDIRSSQILLMAVVSPQISVGHLEQYHASEGEQSSNVHKLCLCYEQKKFSEKQMVRGRCG